MSIAVFIAACCSVLAALAGEDVVERPSKWAQPIEIEGAPNLHQVSDDLYRSAQPTAEGMKNLEAESIKTIVNLRSFHSDRDEIRGTGLEYEHLYVKAWHPERKEVVRFLEVATDPERTPVLVHCMHGADRTGIMCAIYRVAVEGWTKDDALEEMTEGGFGYHEIWRNLPEWFLELDIDAIEREAGLNVGEPEIVPETVVESVKPDEYNHEKARSAGDKSQND